MQTATDLNGAWSAANYTEQASSESFDDSYDMIVNIIPADGLSKYIRIQVISNY